MRIRLDVVRHHAPALVLLVAGIMLAYPEWLTPESPTLDDLSNLNMPQRMFLTWAYQHFIVPLWNPYSFAGQPFLAAGQSGPFYLPNVLYLCLPIARAWQASTLLHAMLCALGMYGLAYHLTKGRLAAFVSALSFATCGFFLGHQIHTQMFDAFAWLPVIVLLQGRLWVHPTLPRVAAFAACLAMQVYAGHPQMVFYTVIALVIDLIPRVRKATLRQWMSWLGGVALALSLSAPQWANTLNLVTYSDRVHVSAAFLLTGSLSPWAFVQWLVADSAGGGWSGQPFSAARFFHLYGLQFWESWCSIGLITFVFGLTAVFVGWRRHPVVRPLALAALVTALFALGGYGPFAWFLVYVPGFHLFRVPARYIGLCDFYLSLLAGVGFSLWQAGASRQSLARACRWVCLVSAVLLLVDWLAGPLREAPVLAVLTALALLVGIAGWMSAVEFQSDTGRLFGRLAAVGAVWDTVLHGWLTAPLMESPHASYQTTSPVVHFLEQHLSTQTAFPRAASLGATDVQLDRGLAYRIPMVNGYDSLEPAWYAENIDLTWSDVTFLNQPRALADALGVKYIVTPARDEVLNTRSARGRERWQGRLSKLPAGPVSLAIQLSHPPSVPTGGWGLQTWMSVTLTAGRHSKTYWINGLPESEYLIDFPKDWPHRIPTQVQIVDQAWNAEFTLQSLTLYGSQQAPIIYPIHQTLAAPPWKPVLTTRRQVIWANPDAVTRAWFVRTKDAALLQRTPTGKLVDWGLNQQVWRMAAPSSGWFILSQMFDPNWHATVDGKRVPITRVGRVLTAIPVRKGAHEITLTYQPVTLIPSLAAGAAGLIPCALGLAWALGKRKGPQRVRRSP